MSDNYKKRVEELVILLDKIPEEKQEGVLIGVKMLAAVYEPKKNESQPN